MYIFDNNNLNNASINDNFFSQTRSVDAKVELINGSGTVIKTLDSTNDLISIEISRSVQSENDFMGCAISKEYTLSIMDKEKSIDFTHIYVKPYIGVKVGEAIQYAPFPKANVYEANYDTVKKVWSLTCYDDMQKLNNILLKSLEPSASILTLRGYALEVCALAGITLSAKSFYNENVTLSVNDWQDNSPLASDAPFRPNFSGEEYLREVIARIAQTALSNAVINRSGELEFVSVANSFNQGTSPYITSDNYFSFSTHEKFGPINTIVLSREETEDNIYYPDIDDRSTVYMDDAHTMTVADHITLYGVHELKIYDNPFFDRSTGDASIDTRESYTQGIFEEMRGMTYTAYNLEFRGNPAIDEGDRIKIEDLSGNEIETTYFSDILSYNGGLKSTSEGKIISQTATEYDKASTVNDLLRQTQIKVDKNEGTLTFLTSDVNTIKDDLANNYSTTSKVNKLIQEAESGLTNTFSKTGGTNLLRNTAPYFGDESSWDYWDGNVKRESEKDSISGYALVLQNGTVSQQVLLTPNTYTLGFKYKISNNVTASVGKFILNNNNEIDLLEEREKQEIVMQVNVEEEMTLLISFQSDTNNAIKIYDLMLNTGKTNMAWTQNVNETVSDTVNISKGIEVSSNTTNTKTRLDSDGFRILDKSTNTEIFRATSDDKSATGVYALKIEVPKENGSANIAGLFIQNIDEEVWISGI